MKRTIGKLSATLAIIAFVAAARADNPCLEQPVTNDLTCLFQGSLHPGYFLAPTSININVGEQVIPPAVYNLAASNGWASYYVSNYCNPDMSGLYTNQNVVASLGNTFFTPPIPTVFWNPGTYYYTCHVAVAGSPCSTVTNTIGTVVYNVSSNTPDVLINVDFDGLTISPKSGYAATGDSVEDFWNSYSHSNTISGMLTNLLTAERQVSPVALTVNNLPTFGTNGSPDPMYNSWLSTNGNVATLALTNLPAGNWQILLYSDDGSFDLSVRGTNNNLIQDYGLQSCYDVPLSTLGPWSQGVQYVSYVNVAVGTGQSVLISIYPGRNGIALVSGLQIASATHVPMPFLDYASVVAWGYNGSGQCNVPAGLTNVVAIAAGGSHSMALDDSGNITAWGLNEYSQCVVPTDLQGVVAIAAGGFHSLALVGDGSVVAWGNNGFDECNVPVALTNAVAIAGGAYHSLALTAGGTPIAWGYNGSGQCNVPSGLSNVTAIAAGGYHCLALSNGIVVGWGNNSFGQAVPPAGLSNVVAIAGGFYHSVALKSDGTVVSWGYNVYGQTNVPAGLTNVVAITAGWYHCLALKADGTVVGWGFDAYGETNIPSNLTNVVAIAGGGVHSLALRNPAIPPDQIASLYPAGSRGSFNPVLDQDYDGVSDLQEMADRTDPDNPQSVLPIRLGSWSFDDTNAWTGDQGQLPIAFSEIVGVRDWSSNAVFIDPAAILAVSNVMVVSGADHPLIDTTYVQSGPIDPYFENSDESDGGVYSNIWYAVDSENAIAMQGDWKIYNFVSGIFQNIYQNTNGLNSPYPPVTGWIMDSGGTGYGDSVPPSSVIPEPVSNLPEALVSDTNYMVVTGAGEQLANGVYSPILSDYEWTNTVDGYWIQEDGFAGGMGYNLMNPSGDWRYDIITHRDNNGNLGSHFGLWATVDGTNPPPIVYPLITTNYGAYLKYRDVETNGNANVNLRNGTIRFWFQPDWSGTNAGGSGPGSSGRLFEMGQAGPNTGWWTLMLNSNGTSLSFITQTNGVGMTNLIAPVNWTTGIWHQVTLTYCGTNSALYIDGQPLTIGSPVQYWPSLAERANGFCIGSDQSGANLARGAFEKLETFNYPLTASVVTSNFYATVPLLITNQPQGGSFAQAQNIPLTVGAVGIGTLFYQWQFNGTNIAGATNPTLVLSNAAPGNSGIYTVTVSNSTGSTSSIPAQVTVFLLPTVTLNSPANGQVFHLYPTNLVLTATASVGDGSIVSVDFYNGTTPLGSDSTPPYTLTWSNVAAGDYVLTAYAMDNNGVLAASAPVNISVAPSATVSITSPTNNSTFVTPTNVVINATASDTNGTLAKVEFFAGSVMLGSFAPTTNNLYSLTWTNPPPGTWSLTAAAIDILGTVAVSSPIVVTVNPSTNFVPTANAYVWDGTHSNQNFGGSAILNVQSSGTGTNRDTYFTFNLGGLTNITSAKLNVYASLGATGAVSVAAYSVTNTSWGEYTITWSNKPARIVALTTNTLTGTNGAWYQFDVTTYARTNSGLLSLALHEPTNSAQLVSISALENSSNPPALVVITSNALSAVRITSPASNSVFVTPSNGIPINATASDVTGVAQVQYFTGSTNLGAASTPPYTVTWTNPPAGTNWLTAVATGNGGLSVTSSLVSVIVEIPPTVTLTNPANNSLFLAGTNITLSAAAASSGSTIKQVQFFRGWTNSLGIDTTAPYQSNWNSVAVGSYVLTAVATDNNGLETTSAPVNIVVDAPPAVSITTPGNSTSFGLPTNITITATASSSDGTSPQVQFYVGSRLLGGDTSAPYSVIWSNPPVGTYILKAVATDDYGVSSTATITNVTVATNFLPAANAYVWDGTHSNQNFGGSAILNVQSSGTGTNRDTYFTFNLEGLTNISSAKLNVYASLGATGAVSVAAYSVTNTSWGEYTITWSNKPARVVSLTTNTLTGTNWAWYQFDVTTYARTNVGLLSLALHEPTNSAQLVSISALENSSNPPTLVVITTNTAPAVSILSPTNNSVLTSPSTLISAVASDQMGVSQVQFFSQGSNSLGVVTAPPYNLTWNSSVAGSFALTAVAVNNAGVAATSAVVNVVVKAPVTITQQPSSQIVAVGQTVTFAVSATGTTPIHYQWYTNNVSMLNATNAVLSFTNVQTGAATNYMVVLTNSVNSVTSSVATLLVAVPPVIVTQPANVVALPGSNVTFAVSASGTAPLSYQWCDESGPLDGATNATLSISNVQPSDDGVYFVIVENAGGWAASYDASLVVLSSATADSDYDGRNNAQEVLDGTDPFNPNSVLQVMLGFWTFNDTNQWSGSAGQLPLSITNIVGVPTSSTNLGLLTITNAALIDSTNPAILCYRDVETNGNANINCRSGTVSFWFKPDWSSGTGPGGMGRLIEIGNYSPSYTNGWWALYFNPTGTQLNFGSSSNGLGGVNLTANISLVSNQWHQVVLTYSPTNSSLYLDSVVISTNGLGPLYYPGPADRALGFRIGSDTAGANQARGAFDDLETFNYPLNALGVLNNYVPLESDGDGILNVFIDIPANGAVLQ